MFSDKIIKKATIINNKLDKWNLPLDFEEVNALVYITSYIKKVKEYKELKNKVPNYFINPLEEEIENWKRILKENNIINNKNAWSYLEEVNKEINNWAKKKKEIEKEYQKRIEELILETKGNYLKEKNLNIKIYV